MTVNKATPRLRTKASGPVIVGANIHDVAHLSVGFARMSRHTSSLCDWTADVCSSELIAVPPAQTVAGAGDYTSGNFATAAVGTYRWRAFYSGDANNNAVDTACNDANESSTVNKATPSLSTDASGPVIVGANIHDVAHLSGGFAPLSGSVSFQVFAPGDTTCATPIAVPPAQTVAGAGDYTSGNFATAAVGTYRWRAFYSGDANNNAVDTACNDANESSTVNKATPSLSTDASGPVIVGANIHDVAHLSGGFAPLSGSVSFQVFAPGGSTCEEQTAVPPAQTE